MWTQLSWIIIENSTFKIWNFRILNTRRKEYSRPFDFSIITHVHTQKPSAFAYPDMLQVIVSVFELPYRRCVKKYPNTELFLVRIHSECGKIRTRNNSVFGHISPSAYYSIHQVWSVYAVILYYFNIFMVLSFNKFWQLYGQFFSLLLFFHFHKRCRSLRKRLGEGSRVNSQMLLRNSKTFCWCSLID